MKRHRDNAEHYRWGEGCDGWHLLRSATLSVIEEQMPPGASERLHFHTNAQQFFYLLKGEALLEVNGENIRLSAREGLHIAAGAQHRITNTSNETIEFLVISEPPSHGDRVNVTSPDEPR
jgi:mannose-6-phosphate isomerase-like protein (cupin superfamily)